MGGATNVADAANANLAVALTGGQVHTSTKVAFQVNNNVGLVVADGNRAQAASTLCEDCKTVAVAVQIDLAAGPVVSIHALNKAISTEYRTVNSDTCASAYQFVIAPNRSWSSRPRDGRASLPSRRRSERRRTQTAPAPRSRPRWRVR
jgi:hypothetical protein